MKRPLAVIGFTYLAALQAALFLGTDYIIAFAAFFISGFFVSLIFKDFRKNKIFPVIFAVSSVALLMLYGYTFAYVEPVKAFYGKTAVISGKLCDVPYEQNGRCYYKIETDSIQLSDGNMRGLNTKILVSSKKALDIDLYDTISAEVSLFEKSEKSYELMNISRGIYLRGIINEYSNITVLPSEKYDLYYYPLIIKKSVIKSIYKLLPKDCAALTSAVIIGDRSGLSDSVKDDFRAAGISHIISISGFHAAVIAQMLLWLFQMFIENKPKAVALSIFSLFIYMAAAGFYPSITRAGIMQIIYLLSEAAPNNADNLNSLSISAFIMCWLNPYAAADISFILSFSATLGIIFYSQKIYVYLSQHFEVQDMEINNPKSFFVKILKKPASFVFSSVSLTLAAVIFTIPTVIIFFRQFAVYTIISNLIISPAAVILISAGILMVICDLSVIFSFVILPFRILCCIMSKYIMWAAYSISNLPFSMISLSKEYILIWLFLMIFALVLMYLLNLRKIPKKLFVVSLAVMVVFAAIDRIINYDTLKISILDTGNGMSVIADDGKDFFIFSCGGDSTGYYNFNSYLKNSAVDNINFMFIDDIQNNSYAEYVLENYNVNAVQVYDENTLYERTYRLISGADEKIFSNSDGGVSVVHIGKYDIMSLKNDNVSALRFNAKGKNFMILYKNSDCNYLPENWKNTDFLICGFEVENADTVKAANIIDITNAEFSGNISVKLNHYGNINIGRESTWLS